jgi:hypothetical protein
VQQDIDRGVLADEDQDLGVVSVLMSDEIH